MKSILKYLLALFILILIYLIHQGFINNPTTVYYPFKLVLTTLIIFILIIIITHYDNKDNDNNNTPTMFTESTNLFK